MTTFREHPPISATDLVADQLVSIEFQDTSRDGIGLGTSPTRARVTRVDEDLVYLTEMRAEHDSISGITVGAERAYASLVLIGGTQLREATFDDDERTAPGAPVLSITEWDPLAGQSTDMQIKLAASFTCAGCDADVISAPVSVETSGQDEAYGTPHIRHVAYAACPVCDHKNYQHVVLPGQDKFGQLS